MTLFHALGTNTHQITLHTLKIKPIRADKFHTKDKSGNSKKFFLTKKAVLKIPRKQKGINSDRYQAIQI